MEQILWPEGVRREVWMIVDGARDRNVYRTLLDSFYTEHSCLYSGPLSPEVQIAAPYLVPLEAESKGTRKLLRRSWGQSWGVFVVCRESQTALRRQLRTLLVVRDERGKKLLFRYYDPRVLRVYLPTCTSEELRAVFGPIERFLVEDDATEELIDFSLERGRLVTHRRRVSAPDSSEAARAVGS